MFRDDEFLMATIDGNADKVAEIIELAHETYTSVLTYNDENSLSCVLTMAYFTACYILENKNNGFRHFSHLLIMI